MSDEAEKKGFTQGVAWALALMYDHPHSPETMLRESGLNFDDFKRAGVDTYDLRKIRAIFTENRIPLTEHPRRRQVA